jgi:hypothetical protein
MPSWGWTVVWTALLIVGFAIVAIALERIRGFVAARTGLGGFYRRFPQNVSSDRLVLKVERLGDYFLNRASSRAFWKDAEWEWRLGSDLKQVAELARIETDRQGDADFDAQIAEFDRRMAERRSAHPEESEPPL